MAGGIYSGLGRGINSALEIFLSMDADQKARERQAQLDRRDAERDALAMQVAQANLAHSRAAAERQQEEFDFRKKDRERNLLLDRFGASSFDTPLDQALALDLERIGEGSRIQRKPTLKGSVPAGVGFGLMVPDVRVDPFRKPTPEEHLALDAQKRREAALAKLPEHVRPFAEGGVDPNLAFFETPEARRTFEREKDQRDHVQRLAEIREANAGRVANTRGMSNAEFMAIQREARESVKSQFPPLRLLTEPGAAAEMEAAIERRIQELLQAAPVPVKNAPGGSSGGDAYEMYLRSRGNR